MTPMRATNNNERCFILHISGQEDIFIGIGSSDNG